jgi:predicted enzyme related to lactoylglutathione lyase
LLKFATAGIDCDEADAWSPPFCDTPFFDTYESRRKNMPEKSNDAKVDYIELPGKDLSKTKAFYERAFGWKFTDYGPDYTSFEDGRLAGGFTKDRQVASGGPLIVIYGHDLAATERKVVEAGGHISREAFSFPGGRRFHFTDPNGNELAVWSDNS